MEQKDGKQQDKSQECRDEEDVKEAKVGYLKLMMKEMEDVERKRKEMGYEMGGKGGKKRLSIADEGDDVFDGGAAKADASITPTTLALPRRGPRSVYPLVLTSTAATRAKPLPVSAHPPARSSASTPTPAQRKAVRVSTSSPTLRSDRNDRKPKQQKNRRTERGRKAAAIRRKGAMDFEALLQHRSAEQMAGYSGSDEESEQSDGSLELKARDSMSSEDISGAEIAEQVLQPRNDSPMRPFRDANTSTTVAVPHVRSQSLQSVPMQNNPVYTTGLQSTPPDAGPQSSARRSLPQTPTPTGGRYIPLRHRPNGYFLPSGSRNNVARRDGFRPSQRQRTPRNKLELKIDLFELPLSWTTWDVHQLLMPYGRVDYIALRDPSILYQKAFVCFRPAPPDISWVGTNITCDGLNGERYSFPTIDRSSEPQLADNPKNKSSPTDKDKRRYLNKILVPVRGIKMGVMRDEDEMLVLHSIDATGAEMTLDMRKKAFLQLDFTIQMPVSDEDGTSKALDRQFKMKIDLMLLHEMRVLHGNDGRTSLVLTTEEPPLVFRKTTNIRATHDPKQKEWKEEHSWFRQTDVDANPIRRTGAIQLQKKAAIIDTGRWTTVQIVCNHDVAKSTNVKQFFQALGDHNISLETYKDVHFDELEPDSLWEWQKALSSTKDDSTTDSSLFDMQQMADDSVHLDFSVHYQLEVCLSVGALHESNIDRDFLTKLCNIETLRAVKILEKITSEGKRIYKPNDIFSLHNRVSVVEKKRPDYCTKTPAVNITPTTIYFSTPVLETSNRVVRKYQKYEDRFMRVKFTDEKHQGRIQAQDGNGMNEVFSRIKQAMTHGIRVAGRHYEFLAFGNAQFREHGAYFFASTPELNADMIRQWMGNFTQIKNVAKYISRLGQCFTTTRAIPHSVTVERIPDVERNGYCFTDGVGKISIPLASMVADRFRLTDCPSVFQFRMAGCKGVLAIDPSLKGMTIQIRPSQEKFPAAFHGLEICRTSQFSAANLNMQLILVMSSLGVPDDVFVRKYREMLADLAKAMTNEETALKLLQKNIDYSQMTIHWATMILDGFMAAQDPFMISCLRLWRSWNLKYLKEKARVFIDQGAFVFGVTDETGTLRGQFESVKVDEGDIPIPTALPQIFLQIPSSDERGGYTVITGPCLFARNPSLHPGDVRMVEAVDVPALHHLKDCVVLPQTGDRDLANMCSGGDLDGDDYLISWDPDLFPPQSEWNYPPMDYTSPSPVLSDGPVTVDDMTSFFVNYIKNDKLGRIATNHRAWADREDDGVMNEKCLQLANLHSMAVDYNKTGVPATLPPELRIGARPHWAEPHGAYYISRKVLGKLYDEVKLDNFLPAWDLPFDARILTAATPSQDLLAAAAEVKVEYDESVRRIMKQYGIKNEFEVFTTFVQAHHNDMNDFKFCEKIGEVRSNLVEEFKGICYTRAGTDIIHREWTKLKPFLVAMYTVTANQVGSAVASSKETVERGGRLVPKTTLTFNTVPLMSFPWIFTYELGRIANGRDDPNFHHATAMPRPTLPKKNGGQADKGKKLLADLIGEGQVLPDLPEIRIEERVLGSGEVLDLYHGDEDGGDLLRGQDGGGWGSKGEASSKRTLLDGGGRGDSVVSDDDAVDNVEDSKASSPPIPPQNLPIPADLADLSNWGTLPLQLYDRGAEFLQTSTSPHTASTLHSEPPSQPCLSSKSPSRPSTPAAILDHHTAIPAPALAPYHGDINQPPPPTSEVLMRNASEDDDENQASAAVREKEEGNDDDDGGEGEEQVLLTFEDNPSRKWWGFADEEGRERDGS